MAIGYVLYNNMAGYQTTLEDVKCLEVVCQEELKFIDITKVKDYNVFLSGLEQEDYLIICGGDGTLNRFVNDTDGLEFSGDILYYPTGTGNDFAHELGKNKDSTPFPVKKYLKNLPWVEVNGKRYRFLNNVGYGIDGYCCEVGDELKKTSEKKINYTMIAIKGLLFHFKPRQAKITVDGRTSVYDKVWIAPTMNGKFYGGGMMPTPEQDRLNERGTLSTMVFHSSGKLKTLLIFPSLFQGKHVKYEKNIDILTGKNIIVEFDRLTPLQIDGETVLGVTSYKVSSAR